MDIKKAIEAYKQDIIEDIRSLLAIKSVMGPASEGKPFGDGPTEALNHALALGEKLGFKSKNLDNYCGYLEIGEGDELIGVLAHVDIVPEGDNWKHDPYAGEIDDNKIFGRGTTDNKGPAIVCMYAMKILADMGIPLNKRIRLVLGANEESGFNCMKYYRTVEEDFSMGFTPDANFPLIFGEKGFYRSFFSAREISGCDIVLLDINGGEAVNVVAPSCRAVLKADSKDIDKIEAEFITYAEKNADGYNYSRNEDTITLELHGISAHASRPQSGLNAISLLVLFLNKFLKESLFINGYSELIGMETDGKSLGVSCADEYGALTLNIGLISMIDNTINASIDIRYPITVEFEPYIDILDETFRSKQITNETTSIDKPLFVDPSSDFIKALHSAYINVTGDKLNQPFTIGGGTYARVFKNVVAYGLEFPNSHNNVHMKDEFLDLDDISVSTEIYVNALLNLLQL